MMMDFIDFLDPEDPAFIVRTKVCPRCHLEVPVSGECC